MEKEIIINNQPDEITRIAQFNYELVKSLQHQPTKTKIVFLKNKEAINKKMPEMWRIYA